VSRIRGQIERCRQFVAPPADEGPSYPPAALFIPPERVFCRIGPAASPSEIEQVSRQRPIPDDAVALWEATGGAELFIGAFYGGCGLQTLGPAAAAVQSQRVLADWRSDQFVQGDLVLGEFLDGEGELLAFDAAGLLMIAMSPYPRDEWYWPAPDLGQFLSSYIDAEGKKFWELT
jgi:hypothetical protein